VILEPGAFNVNEYRKAIPTWVKLQTLLRAALFDRVYWSNVDARDIQFDHDPSLVSRPYDTEIEDFVPAQNDPNFIIPMLKADHLHKTTGRNPGAERTITVRGSDIGEAVHVKKVRSTQQLHELKIATKNGDPEALAKLLNVEKKKRPKGKIPSRPFPKHQRSMRVL